MMSALAGSYTESWLVGDISGRSTFCSCATATCCPITTCVTTCSPPRGGPSCSLTGAAALASATGMMRTASPGPSTAVKPCAFSAERNTWYAPAIGMGRAETMVTCPLTRGSISMFRPVICDIALTTACRSALWKLSSTSPDLGATVTGPEGRAAGAVSGGSAEGAAGVSGACAGTACAATARAPARIRPASAEVFLMSVRRNSAARGPSAHIVVQRLVLALPLHVHENALGGPELLVQAHHVVHAGERLAVDVADHVARSQAELLVQASGLNLAHQKPSVGVGHDESLVEKFRAAHLLLQLPPVDELPIGAGRLNDRGRRSGDSRGGPLDVLHEYRFACAVADDHDAVAMHCVQPHAGGKLLARTESRLGLSLHDDERAAAGGAHGDAGQRHVQIAGRDARFGGGAPRGRGAPEKLSVGERAQIGELGAPGAHHRGRGWLEHAPGSLRQRPAQREQRSNRRRGGHRAMGEHAPGRGRKALHNRKGRCRHGLQAVYT